MSFTRWITSGLTAAGIALGLVAIPAQAEDIPVVWWKRERIACVHGQTVHISRVGRVVVTPETPGHYLVDYVDWKPRVQTVVKDGCAGVR